jgi:hypothetical protein
MTDPIDVKAPVLPTNPNPVVEPNKDGDDKDKNIAALRTRKEALEKENDQLRKDIEEARKAPKKEEKPDPVKDDTMKVIFDRDTREATRQWTKGNKVTAEEWKSIQEKVSLNGDETISEITDKIDEAYQSLPHVREKREKDLIEKGKKIAMTNFQDDELDIGGGGDVDLGGGGEANLTGKEKGFLSSFGVSPDEQKKIDKTKNPNSWQPGPSPTRKFFDGSK